MVYAIARLESGQSEAERSVAPPVGLFVEAEIDGLALENVVVLPRSALRNGEYVLVVDTENRVHLRQVDVLRVYRDEVYITGGLRSGERVSVSMLQTVVEGMRVQPIEPDA
jgi:multidrug efflux pump subunit AcrA (membrane-fusion protein)